MSEHGNGEQGRSTYFEAYTDYQTVTKRVAKSVEDALDAYAAIASAHQEGKQIQPEMAAECKRLILSAAMRLLVELEQNEDSDEEYQEILKRWRGSEETEGRIKSLQESTFRSGMPGWMFQFMLDVRRAGWKLGYLRAGEETREELDDPAEQQAEQMFANL